MEKEHLYWYRKGALDKLKEIRQNYYLRPKRTKHAPETYSEYINHVLNTVCDYFNICMDTLCRNKKHSFPLRKGNYVTARHLTVYFLSKNIDMSYRNIAQQVGLKDHSCTYYSLRYVNNFLSIKDEKIIKYVNDLNQLINKNQSS